MMRRAAPRIVLLMSATSCGGLVAEQPEAGASDAATYADGAADVVDASCVAEQCTDPHQCGTTGHDCHGGACVNGTCQPVVIATSNDPPFDIAIDATDIYWSTSVVGTVVRCSIDGCNKAPTPLPNTSNASEAIAVVGSSLYWIGNDGSISGCSLPTCSTPTLFASAQYFPSDVAADGTNIYWADAYTINACSLTGCAGDPALASGQHNVTAIAVDGANVYWTNYGNGVSGIMRCAIGGCGSPTMLASAKWPLDLVSDGKFVYWTDYDDRTVMKCAADGSNPTVIAHGNRPYGIAVDDADVYWTDHDDFAVMKCAKSGCSGPLTIASNQLSAARIVVDAQNIYWATVDTVMKLAK